MAARKRGNGAARTVVRLSLPVICTVALSGAGLGSALASEPPANGGKQFGSSVNYSANNNTANNNTANQSGVENSNATESKSDTGTGSGGDAGNSGNTHNSDKRDAGDAATTNSTDTSITNTNTTNVNSTTNTNANSTSTNTTNTNANTTGEGNEGENKSGDTGNGDTGISNPNDASGEPKLGQGSTDVMLGEPAGGGSENMSKGALGATNDTVSDTSGAGGDNANNANNVGENGADKKVEVDARENGGAGGTGNNGGDGQGGDGAGTENGRGVGESEDASQEGLTLTTFAAANLEAGNESGQQWTVSYDYNAGLYSEVAPDNKPYAGVYATEISPNAEGGTKSNDGKIVEATKQETIGMPSIADKNLENKPTTESPAIIAGAAVGYEEKTGAVEYNTIQERDAPYSEFKWNIVDEQKAGETTSHKKLTGYDGTYVIVRLDVSDFFEATGLDGSAYLHVKQEGNNTLLAAIGMATISGGKVNNAATLTDGNTFTGIPNANGSAQPESGTSYELTWKDEEGAKSTNVIRTGSYKLSDLVDKTTDKPYLDILVFATASHVAGADAGKQGALNGDIPISVYVDNTEDYEPDLKYNAQSQDPYHAANCLGKYYDVAKAATNAAATAVIEVSKYLVKGSDLALETMVKESGGESGKETTYWSLAKSFEKTYYDQEIDKSADDQGSGRTISLMSEVAVTADLKLEGTDANNLRKRTLDVNSFDVQVANNTGQQDAYKVGFNLQNAWLTIADYSNTTGAELAIGNNSKFVIDAGGRLIIDKTCQLEIEWDGATVAPAEGNTGNTGNNATQQQIDILNNGMLDLKSGGTVVNNGIITIEGTEGKPYQETTKEQVVNSEKGYGEFLVQKGATLINNGALMVYGKLYNLGTIENNGSYNDTIVSNDPDKGQFTYHKGIQVSWKDDVRQDGVVSGEILNGVGKDGAKVTTATIVNKGDILLVPGTLTNYGTIDNQRYAHILEAPVTEVIIPYEPTSPTDPGYKRMTVKEAFSTKDPNKEFEDSYIKNYGTIINRGIIATATVVLNDNTSFGTMRIIGDHPERFNFTNDANAHLTNYGYIPGYPTEVEPTPTPEPEPTPKPEPKPWYDPEPMPVPSSSSHHSSSSQTTPESTNTQPATQPTVEQAIKDDVVKATITQVGVEGGITGKVCVVADPVVKEIADGVYEIVSMPAIDVDALVANDPDHDVDDVAEIWWCVYIDGVKVRIMDIYGHLASGIARVVWADDADFANATLAGIDLGDGAVICLTPDTPLFLEILWA